MTDTIADMLTRIRNALMARQDEVAMPYSKLRHQVAEILVNEGFIERVEKDTQEDNGWSVLRIGLRYKQGGSVIRGLKRVSKPGRRVYRGYKDIPTVLPSLGIWILSTSHGLKTNIQAKKEKTGGEIICEIY